MDNAAFDDILSPLKGVAWIRDDRDDVALEIFGEAPPEALECLKHATELRSLEFGYDHATTDEHLLRLPLLPHLRSICVRSELITRDGVAHLIRQPALLIADCEGIAIQCGFDDDRAALGELKLQLADRFLALDQKSQIEAAEAFRSSEGCGGDGDWLNARLSQCSLHDGDLVFLSPFRSLRSIDLFQSHDVTSAGLHFLRNLTAVEELRLGQTSVDDLAHLAKMTSLRTLHVHGLNITDEHAEVIEQLSNLEELNLGYTRVTDETIRRLSNHRKLRKLDLSGELDISDEGLRALSGLTSLESLQIGNKYSRSGLSKVTDDGIRHLSSLKNLIVLELGVPITDDALEHLLELKSLECLTLGGNVGIVAAQNLANDLPNVSIEVCNTIVKREIDGISFNRFQMTDQLSFLVPERWQIVTHSQEEEHQPAHAHVREDGYEHRSSYPSEASPVEFRVNCTNIDDIYLPNTIDRDGFTAEKYLQHINDEDYGRLKQKVANQSGDGSDSACYAIQHGGDVDPNIWHAWRIGDRIILLTASVGASQFKRWEPVLAIVCQSLRHSKLDLVRCRPRDADQIAFHELDEYRFDFGLEPRLRDDSDQRFLRNIADDSTDIAQRLAYAKWLEEKEDPRGTLIRLHCEIDQGTPPKDSEQQIADLMSRYGTAWKREVIALGAEHVGFANGFVASVKMRANDFAKNAKQLFQHAPLLNEIELSSFEHFETLENCTELQRITSLKLPHNDQRFESVSSPSEQDNVERFCGLIGNPEWCNLQQLRLPLSELTATGAEAIANASHLGKLELLEIHSGDIGTKGVEAICNAEQLGGLRELDLGYCKLPDEAAILIATSPYLNHLQHLLLHRNFIEDTGIISLATSQNAASLRSLELSNNQFGNAGLRAISETNHLSNLRTLKVASVQFDNPTMRDFCRTNHLRRLESLSFVLVELETDSVFRVLGDSNFELLTELDLGGCKIGDEGFVALKDAARLSQLKALRVVNNDISSSSVIEFARSERIVNLRVLDLGMNDIGADGVQALIDSPYLDDNININVSFNDCLDLRADFYRRFKCSQFDL